VFPGQKAGLWIGVELGPASLRPEIALPSTSGGRSRIVPAISGPVTVPRSDACVIVTEYGIADLRGLSLSERTSRLITVAHPDHREELEGEVSKIRKQA